MCIFHTIYTYFVCKFYATFPAWPIIHIQMHILKISYYTWVIIVHICHSLCAINTVMEIWTKWHTLSKFCRHHHTILRSINSLGAELIFHNYPTLKWNKIFMASQLNWLPHDDVIKCKHFPRYWPFVRGIHRSPVNSPHKGQWRGALMLTLICARINAWVNNREAGDLRRTRVHYDVIVMEINSLERCIWGCWQI